MITPTQKWRKYRTERGICINEDCEKVIQKYLAPNFEGKIQTQPQMIFILPNVKSINCRFIQQEWHPLYQNFLLIF